MNFETSSTPDQERRRRQLTNTVKERLRATAVQLSLLNQQVSTHIDLRVSDLGCLDIVGRYGPLSPSALARRTGMHPATLTGVLDRLEKGGWVSREADPADRRAVVVRALRNRAPEIFRLYAGMNALMDDICADYDESQLELLDDFLRRVADAGQEATDDFTLGTAQR